MTLLELLVVIAILVLLMALLLPAVQSVRETARLTQCRNHARQLAIGCITHLDTQTFWPSGGWGYAWTGEPDRGFGKGQPGGWAYAVLPYVEQTAVHQMGAGLATAAREAAISTRASTAVTIFYCPSRRTPTALPASTAHTPANCPRPATFAKTDYAMNIGDVQVGGQCLPAGPPKSCLTDYPGGSCFNASTPGASAANWYGSTCDPATFNGLSTHRSEMPASEVTDGMSTTLLVAEKNLNPDRYLRGDCAADNGDAWQGRDWDTSRWTAQAPFQDTRGSDQIQRFGGPHSSGVVAAACDGAVRVVPYSVDAGVWRRLGNCQDTRTGADITSWPGR